MPREQLQPAVVFAHADYSRPTMQVVTITHEVNGGEYETDIVILTAEPITKITVRPVVD